MRSVVLAVVVLLRMAVLANADDTEPSAGPRHDASQNLDDAERNAFFRAVATAGGKVYCERLSRYRVSRGNDLYSELRPLRNLACLAHLYCLRPHRVGVADVLSRLSLVVDSPTNVEWLEHTLFGSAPGYTVVIRESPSLAKDVELLSRIPNLVDVVIQTKQMDEPLLKAVGKIQVLGSRYVGYRNANYYVLFTLSGSRTAYVDIEKAEEAIPSLKTVSRLEAVGIVAPLETDQGRAERVVGNVKKALPNVVVFLSGPERSNLAIRQL